jgi:excinuclease ABC subunit A
VQTGANTIQVRGAAENNLHDVDAGFCDGLTAVVGLSGSGKSSLVFDVLYREARRRFLEIFSLRPPWLRAQPARVRGIDGLRPAVAVAQNVVNLNPNSTLASALGIHPFLRVLYARFAERHCPYCGAVVTVTSGEHQLAVIGSLLATTGQPVPVAVPLVRGVRGSHARLLSFLADSLGADSVSADGRAWGALPGRGTGLDPGRAHDITVRVGTAQPGADAATLRSILESGRSLGCPQVTLLPAGAPPLTLSREPLCPDCGLRLPMLAPEDFRRPGAGTEGYRLAGRTFGEFLGLAASDAAAALAGASLPPGAADAVDQVQLRLSALSSLELGYLTLDRPSPTLSRGEAQRVRLAVLLANRIEDLLHILDEPTIGLDPSQVGTLMRALRRLRGPVVMVEHDPWAAADADMVVELGPGAGAAGGHVIFEGTPARLWDAGVPSGAWFSGRARPDRLSRRPAPTEWLTVHGAAMNNLRGFDCRFPLNRLTVISGPSGAGKSTLARDVLIGSLQAGTPQGCRAVEGPGVTGGPPPRAAGRPRAAGEPMLRALEVDQNPIGRNPRSNPATYTGLADRIRAIFTKATGLPGSVFSFNRPQGACPECGGMGAVEITMPFLPSEWITCQACAGARFSPDALRAAAELADHREYTIAQVYEMTVDQADGLLADRKAGRILASLRDMGLGYLGLGQPSTSLSGGEAQRVKLVKQLAQARAGDLILLDEPTSGLHPADISRLMGVIDQLVEAGCTVMVIEHHPDVIAAADWVIRLGPGGGPAGGKLLWSGEPSAWSGAERDVPPARPRSSPRPRRRSAPVIQVTGARANNLRDVTVTIPKNAITALVGVSGSGKSSLLTGVLEAEASRRFLESLSMYERQSVREGPHAPVRSVRGLGPTVSAGARRRQFSDPRSTVGMVTGLDFHLCLLLSYAGTRTCQTCGGEQGRSSMRPQAPWRCRSCGAEGPAAAPFHFSPANYEAACLGCAGLGTVQEPRPEWLITAPGAPLCGGAMRSPGFFPQTYLCKPPNGGYWMLQALAERYGFDPFVTPWAEMPEQARAAFLYGDPEPVQVPSTARGKPTRTVQWRGFFPLVQGWDLGGLYTEQVPCPRCGGARLRPEFATVRLGGRDVHELRTLPVETVARLTSGVTMPGQAPGWVTEALAVTRRRLGFMAQVGLAYLHLDRLSSTLSAGEIQRVRLTSLLGAALTGMTVLLDEPTRGLHPREVGALGGALGELRDGGNAVVVVDHDPDLVARADHLVVLGPGGGQDGGRIVAQGPAARLRQAGPSRARRLIPDRPARRSAAARRSPAGWMTIRGAREHNLSGKDVRIPLGVMAGVCGVSGSGKSTLVIDTLARALAPARLTTSVAEDAFRPGSHDSIEGAPHAAVSCDQSRSGVQAPGGFLGVSPALRRAFAASAEAAALGLGEEDLVPRCDSCKGRGYVRQDMGFLATVETACDACAATGYRAEARELRVRGCTLAELDTLTLARVGEIWRDQAGVAAPLAVASSLGLDYLVLGQRPSSLSGGEAQRLKLARELARRASKPTLYILDEPTVGLHALDVRPLRDALHGLVGRGHTVLVVEHDPALLACCDWLMEMGPGAGPDGGHVIATGTPEEVAAGNTPTAPYLRAVLP